MKKLLLRDVGDGLNLLIQNDNNYDLTVDFGGDENLECHYCFDDNFLLTHFHADHYNGILKCVPYNCCWHLDKFYHPMMPSFKDNKILFMSFLAMNIRISNNHPMQSTIFGLVKKLNRRKQLQFIPVAKGDVFTCGNSKYEILWPPKEVEDGDTLKVIKRAIEDFNTAAEMDKTLSDIYRNIQDHYSDRDINSFGENESDIEYSKSNHEKSNENLEVISKANDSLRKAANRLSIAFRQDDNILFLGDLEKREIACVVVDLIKQKNISYDILISAHHGTHWDKSLNVVTSDICLASVGLTLRPHIEYDYKNICNKFIRTDEWGDIKISSKLKVK